MSSAIRWPQPDAYPLFYVSTGMEGNRLTIQAALADRPETTAEYAYDSARLSVLRDRDTQSLEDFISL